jgi:predicted ABC-type ATPase
MEPSFLNADEVTREMLRQEGFSSYSAAPPEILRRSNLAAAEKVFAEVRRLLGSGEAVAVETVLSTDKYRPVIEKPRRDGGIFNLIYVGLRSPELSKQRVAIRVAKGGHPVPAEKLAGRW